MQGSLPVGFPEEGFCRLVPPQRPPRTTGCKSLPLCDLLVCTYFEREGQNLAALKLLPPPVQKLLQVEEKGGLYAHGQEGTMSPVSPQTMPSDERAFCHAPEPTRTDSAPSPFRRWWSPDEGPPPWVRVGVWSGAVHKPQMGKPWT